MVAYVIVDSNVTDPEGFKAYAAKVRDTLVAHGGKPVINTDNITVLEGDWQPKRMVVLQFDSPEAIQGWYNSPEYQEILPHRLASAKDKLLIVEGL